MSISLVPDILMDIFLAVSAQIEPLKWAEVSMEDPVSNKYRHFDGSVRLRELTHVCRYWRDIAIHSPKLWSNHIDCTNMAPKWFQLVLERAQDAHLFVTIPRPYTPRSFPNHTLANFKYLLASGKQFAGLHADVLFHTTEVKNAVLARMAEPMPAMSQCTWFYYPPDPISLNLFGGDAPALRKMYLRGCLPTVHPDIRRRLTHLILLDCPRPAGGWVEFLRQTPQLEELTIGLEPDNELEPPAARLNFPRLTTLTIEGDSGTAGKLLASLQAAQLKHMDVSVNNVPRGDGARRLLNPLASFFPEHEWQTSDTAEIHLRADLVSVKVVTHSGFTISLRARTYGVYKEPQFLAALTTSFKALFSSCNHLMLDGLKGDVDRLHNDPLIVLLLPFNNVTTITLPKTAYARILKYHSYSTRRFERDVVLLPSLQTMILHCSVVKNFDDICAFLVRKVAEGRPILKLCFTAEVDGELQEKAQEKQIALCKDFNVEVDFFKQDEAQVE